MWRKLIYWLANFWRYMTNIKLAQLVALWLLNSFNDFDLGIDSSSHIAIAHINLHQV